MYEYIPHVRISH